MSTSSNNVVETELSLLVLYTHQLPHILRFYEAVGLRFIEERHGSGPIHFAAQLGSVVLELYPLTSGDAIHSNSPLRLGFRVESTEAVLRDLALLGIQPQSTPRNTLWGRVATVQDPDGRCVELLDSSAADSA